MTAAATISRMGFFARAAFARTVSPKRSRSALCVRAISSAVTSQPMTNARGSIRAAKTHR